MGEKAKKKLWNGGWIRCFVTLNLEEVDEERNAYIGFQENGGLSSIDDPPVLYGEQTLNCYCRERERSP